MPASTQVCFSTLGIEREPWSLRNYLTVGGYKAWQRILNGELDRTAVIEIGVSPGQVHLQIQVTIRRVVDF